MTTRRTLLTAALSLGLAAWTAGSAHAQETIRAVTDATFPPMEFVKDGKRTGFDIELVEAWPAPWARRSNGSTSTSRA